MRGKDRDEPEAARSGVAPGLDTAPAVVALAAERAHGSDEEAESEIPDDVRRHVARAHDLAPRDLLRLLDRLLLGPRAGRGLELLGASGLLQLLLPEVAALVGFHTTCRVHHKDLWAHTVEVVERTVADADLRWVALLHDVGKVPTRHVDERGRVNFLRHERVGGVYARGIGARLEMPPERIDRVAYVIEHHARVNAYEPRWSDRAVRRLMRDAGDRLGDLLTFSAADFTTRRKAKASRIRSNLRELRQRIARLRAEDEARPLLPKGMGRVICDALGLAPGPGIGERLAWLEERVRAGDLPARAAPRVYVDALRRRDPKK
ncbi:MAG: HD domain-containing protein [Myxococcota bacterium]